MSAMEMLKGVQFVVDQDGRPSAVQMDIETWEAVLDWLEDIEDRSLIKEAISKLRSGPKNAGALRWEEVRSEWDDSQAGLIDDAA